MLWFTVAARVAARDDIQRVTLLQADAVDEAGVRLHEGYAGSGGADIVGAPQPVVTLTAEAAAAVEATLGAGAIWEAAYAVTTDLTFEATCIFTGDLGADAGALIAQPPFPTDSAGASAAVGAALFAGAGGGVSAVRGAACLLMAYFVSLAACAVALLRLTETCPA